MGELTSEDKVHRPANPIVSIDMRPAKRFARVMRSECTPIGCAIVHGCLWKSMGKICVTQLRKRGHGNIWGGLHNNVMAQACCSSHRTDMERQTQK